MDALQLVSGQAVGTLFDLEESQYMQERMEAERQHQGNSSIQKISKRLTGPDNHNRPKLFQAVKEGDELA